MVAAKLDTAECAEWVASRPACVRILAEEFPPGTTCEIEDRTLFLVGYDENGSLKFSKTDPLVDYGRAILEDECCWIHAECLRKRRIDDGDCHANP